MTGSLSSAWLPCSTRVCVTNVQHLHLRLQLERHRSYVHNPATVVNTIHIQLFTDSMLEHFLVPF